MSGPLTLPQAFPADALPWIEKISTGAIEDIQRLMTGEDGSVIRRESYRIDCKTNSGPKSLFARLDRAAAAGQPSSRGLKRETAIIRYLQQHSAIPVPVIHGFNDDFCMVLQDFERGRADLHLQSRDVQDQVMRHFMELLAQLHTLDISGIDIPGFERPSTIEDHSLAELRSLEAMTPTDGELDFSAQLACFGKRFLLNHVPGTVQRTSLLQGDTGPGNFLFAGNRVSTVIDWEWAHFGDPMEDLGNIWLRNFFWPSCGDNLTPYFEHYAQQAGLSLERKKIIYYLAHQLVRSVMTIPALTRKPDWKSSLALNLGYEAICNLTCCEAIGLYHDIAEPEDVLLDIADDKSANPLYEAVALQLERAVVPILSEGFAQTSTQGAKDIIRYLDRKQQCAAQADSMELDSLNTLLGKRHRQLKRARQALHRELKQLSVSKEPEVLTHLWAIARRQMQLMEPLVERWSYCRLARF